MSSWLFFHEENVQSMPFIISFRVFLFISSSDLSLTSSNFCILSTFSIVFFRSSSRCATFFAISCTYSEFFFKNINDNEMLKRDYGSRDDRDDVPSAEAFCCNSFVLWLLVSLRLKLRMMLMLSCPCFLLWSKKMRGEKNGRTTLSSKDKSSDHFPWRRQREEDRTTSTTGVWVTTCTLLLKKSNDE